MFASEIPMTSNPQPSSCSLLAHTLKQARSPIIIAVAGDSGSGKSTFSDGIRRLLGDDVVTTICTDGYHKENRTERQQSGRLPLDPAANHLDVLAEHLASLKQGQPIQLPLYNHATGEFDPPQAFTPTPIIVVEGLHVLYPEFLPWIDFSIYVDPDLAVKWEWKWARDVKRRGHKAEALESEMLHRLAAYKRWIDFQKTNANVVIKIFPSQIEQWARHRFSGSLPQSCYRMELIMEPPTIPLPSLPLRFDLGALSTGEQAPFLLAAVPSTYWGRRAIALHLDGVLASEAVTQLEQQIVEFTGIAINTAIPNEDQQLISTTRFTQLLIAWRFLEGIASGQF